MLALDPNERFATSVATDEKAKFWFRYMTGRQYRNALAWDRSRRDADTFDPDTVDALYRQLRVTLMGWDGLPVEYDPDRLEDVTTPGEAWELFYKSLQAGRLSVPEKNGSGSESDANSAPSVPDADPGSAPIQ